MRLLFLPLEIYMNSKPRLSTYWVTCADGLETLLREEIEGLGVQNIEQFPGRLVFKGTLEDAYRICMWSRLGFTCIHSNSYT